MDDTFEVPFPGALFSGFGPTFSAAFEAVQAFRPGFEVSPLSEFGGTFAAQGVQTFSPGFQAQLFAEFGGGFSNSIPPQSMRPGFEFTLSSKLWFATDTAFEVLLGPVIIPSFPGNVHMIEILHPIVPISAVNKVLFALDSEEWRVTQKTASLKARLIDTLRFRVDVDYQVTFLADLDSKRTSQFRLTTPGICPFGLSSEDNYVRIITRGRPQREERGLTSDVDVTFLFIATYP